MQRLRLAAALPAAALAVALAATPGSAAPWHGSGHDHGQGHRGDGWQCRQGKRDRGGDRADAPDAGTVSVTGQGQSTVAPDIAVVTVGVTVQAPSAAEAMRQNTERQQVIIDTLKARGIEPRDIQTSGLNLNPVQDYSREGQPPVVTGYQATNVVTVRVRQLPQLGEALDGLVGAGANEINGISFQRENIEEAENEARAAAVENARMRAQVIANAAGMELGRLLSIADQSGRQGPQPMMRAMAMDAAAKESAPVPVEAGELSIAADVSVIWELRPARRGDANPERGLRRGMEGRQHDRGPQGGRGDNPCMGPHGPHEMHHHGAMPMRHGDGGMDQGDRPAQPETEWRERAMHGVPEAGSPAMPGMPPQAGRKMDADTAAASASGRDAPASPAPDQPAASDMSGGPDAGTAAQDDTAPAPGGPAIPAPAN